MLPALPYLEIASCFYATIFVGFGFLWFINPAKALSFFELPYPKVDSKTLEKKRTGEMQRIIDAFRFAYGVRNIFMGAAIYAAALCGTTQALGWIVIAAGCVAGTDGAVCKLIVGKGEMNHWSYAPVLIVLGSASLGAFDGISGLGGLLKS